MTDCSGTIPLEAAAPDAARSVEAAAPGPGLAISRDADGTLRASSADSDAELYLATVGELLVWGTDLPAVARAVADAGTPLAPHHGTVLAYLRGEDTAALPQTFFDGIVRVRRGEEVAVSPDGRFERSRSGGSASGVTARPAAALPRALDEAVAASLAAAGAASAVDATTGEGASGAPVVVLGEDLASAALAAVAPAGSAAVRVHAGSTRAQDSTAQTGGASRARAAAEAAGAEITTVAPTTDRFKRDLADLVRTQGEPFADLEVYAHYCAMREAARHGGVVLDATGPRGAGVLGAGRDDDAAPGTGVLAALSSVREKVASRRRRVLTGEGLAPRAFVASAAGRADAGEPAAEPGLDTGAVLAARRDAARFDVTLALPLASPEVAAALAAAASGGSERTADAALAPFAALAAPSAACTVPERAAAIDTHEWLSRLKGTLHAVFRSASFAGRPWVDQRAVLEAFEAHVAGRATGGDDVFWRLLSLELWMRACVEDPAASAEDPLGLGLDAGGGDAPGTGDDHGKFDEPDPKEPLDPNPGKNLDLAIAGTGVTARRYPLRTGKFAADSDMDAEISRYVRGFFEALDAELAGDGEAAAEHRAATVGRPWNLTVSEKIIAIMQGRSYFVWDVKPSWWAQRLSRYVARTPAGIGLGDPVTMQLAIQEAGLPRVIVASAAGALGKALGKKGWFYHVVGGNVRAIDGPTEYSVYPANVSAKLPPKDPDRVAAHLNDVVRATVPAGWAATFTGTVVMDANDLGRNTLGKTAPASGEHYELQFADNPLGQGREQTPMAVVFER
ncbi:hypothetical protein [Brachybacterium huguangmaarense]